MTGRPITNYNSLSLLPLLSAMAAGSAPNTSRTQMPSFADRCEHEDENAVHALCVCTCLRPGLMCVVARTVWAVLGFI